MILHILQIEFYFCLHYYLDIIFLGIFCIFHQLILISVLDGSWVCNSRPYIQHMHLLLSPIIDVMPYLWTRTYKRHIAYKHIYQLWQLIKLELSDKIPASCYAGIMSTNGH